MAKISRGPIVSSLSGSVGELTFCNCKYGQIVMQKPRRRSAPTAADLTTRNRFRLGMETFKYLYPEKGPAMRAAADRHKITPAGEWTSAWYRYLKTGQWFYTAINGNVPPLTSATIIRTPGTFSVQTNLDTPGGRYVALMFRIVNDSFDPQLPQGTDVQLTTPPQVFSDLLFPDPCTVLLLPGDHFQSLSGTLGLGLVITG